MRLRFGFDGAPLPRLVLVVAVLLAWCAFGLAFVLRARPSTGGTRSRDLSSRVGMVFQAVGYAVVWRGARPLAEPFLAIAPPIELLLLLIAGAFALGGVILAFRAVATLGKQWSLVARVAEGHRLVTEGPFRLVRHPIYTAMLGMLLATAIAVSRPWALGAGLVAFWLGTAIRVRAEERLLAAEFGAEWEAYRGRVPGLFAGL